VNIILEKTAEIEFLSNRNKVASRIRKEKISIIVAKG
jgi:hypothetical protein